jgi:hypothetical protein
VEQAGSEGVARARQRERISGIGEKIETAKLRYQQAWRSADRLDPAGPWSLNFRWLNTKDIRGPSAADDLSDLAAMKISKKIRRDAADLGQGTYERSWIWNVALDGNTDPDGALRVEWAKSQANAERWEEELQLVPEEMRRTLAYFEWSASWWSQRIGARPTASIELQSALDAEARRQEALLRQRIVVFASAWLPYLKRLGLGTSWMSTYKDHIPASAWEAPRRGAALGCECFYSSGAYTCLCINFRVENEVLSAICDCPNFQSSSSLRARTSSCVNIRYERAELQDLHFIRRGPRPRRCL